METLSNNLKRFANGGAELFSLKLHNQIQTIVVHMPIIEHADAEKGTQEDECHDTIDLPTTYTCNNRDYDLTEVLNSQRQCVP